MRRLRLGWVRWITHTPDSAQRRGVGERLSLVCWVPRPWRAPWISVLRDLVRAGLELIRVGLASVHHGSHPRQPRAKTLISSQASLIKPLRSWSLTLLGYPSSRQAYWLHHPDLGLAKQCHEEASHSAYWFPEDLLQIKAQQASL